VHAPVGLDLGARTHEEIALAIVAELVAVRRLGASPRPAGLARVEAHEREKASRSAPPAPAGPARDAPPPRRRKVGKA
jgi:hypothetical protein